MKKLIKITPMIIITLMVFASTSIPAFSADMWAETPDLNNDSEVPSAVVGSSSFTYDSPDVDMWAKTPNLLAEREEHGVYIEVSAGLP